MRDSFEFYKVILDNIYDGVYFVDQNRVITYWNIGAERITGYKADEVVGNRCADNILMHVNEKGQSLCKGVCPLSKAINAGTPHEEELYLLHKSGHRVPIVVKIMPLQDETRKIIGAVEIFSDNTQNKANAEKMKKLAKMAFSDDVTELVNRRYAEMKLTSLLESIKKEFFDIGLLIIDVEYESQQGGQKVSNDILKTVAKTIAANTQPTDVVSRLEDGRFLIISEHSRKSHLLLLSDKLRTLILKSNYSTDTGVSKIAISIGGTNAKTNDSVNSMLQRAIQHTLEVKSISSNSVKVD